MNNTVREAMMTRINCHNLQLSDTNWKVSCSFLKRAHNCEQNQILFASSGLLGEEMSSLNLCQSLKRLVLAMAPQYFRVGETVFSKALEKSGIEGKVTKAWKKGNTWFYKVQWNGNNAPDGKDYAKRSLCHESEFRTLSQPQRKRKRDSGNARASSTHHRDSGDNSDEESADSSSSEDESSDSEDNSSDNG